MKLTTLLMLGVLCAPSILKAQKDNRISVQTGLLHCFFDDSPMMNFNHKNSAKKPFNGLLINSVGVHYSRLLNDKSGLIFGFTSFRESYDKHINKYPSEDPIVENRYFTTFTANYNRIVPVSEHVNFVYGGGLNFRSGSESIIISRGIISDDPNGPIVYEILAENLSRNDFGLNAFAGLEYSPVNWLTLYTKVDFLTSILLNDKNGKRKMKEIYDSPQFPSRYDLSFNLGIGFNF